MTIQVIAHNTQNAAILSLLSSLSPAFEPALHVRRTTFPHVAPTNLILQPLDSSLYNINGRRKRVLTGNNAAQGNNGVGIGSRAGLLGNSQTLHSAPMTITGSSHKKRRLDEDDSVSNAPRRTPLKGKEKEREVDNSAKDRPPPKAKRA